MGAQWPQKAGAVHHSRTEGPAAPRPTSEMLGSPGPTYWPGDRGRSLHSR